MASTSNPRCKACASQHRAEIDGQLVRGESGRAVSAWLEKTHGEKIDFTGLVNHRTRHLNVVGEVRERLDDRLEEAKAAARKQREAERDERAAENPEREEAVLDTLDSVDVLTRLAAIGLRVVESLADEMTSPVNLPPGERPDGAPAARVGIDPAKVALFTGCMRETRQAAVAKHELLHGKKLEVEAAFEGGLGDLLALDFAEEGGGETSS